MFIKDSLLMFQHVHKRHVANSGAFSIPAAVGPPPEKNGGHSSPSAEAFMSCIHPS